MEEETYFTAYADVGVHETMLKDAPRMEFYAKAIEELGRNGGLAGKTVLDVGCGTGVLAMIAARHGAKRVIAVEASPFADVARRIVADNGFAGAITVVNSKVEDMAVPTDDGDKADVIVSEWMGFYLLHEGMLHSVIWARDHLLKPGGIMLPSVAEIFAAPVELGDFRRDHIDFWKTAAGFDMSAMCDIAAEAVASSPSSIVLGVRPCDVVAERKSFLRLDMATVTSAELLAVCNQMEFSVSRDCTFHGIALWFVVGFGPFVLSCSPDMPPTHWQQTVIHFPGSINLPAHSAITVDVSAEANPDDLRRYDLAMEVISVEPPKQ